MMTPMTSNPPTSTGQLDVKQIGEKVEAASEPFRQLQASRCTA